MELPHDRRPSAFESAWNTFRGMVSGPIGCLLAILCFPFAILLLLVMVGIAIWKGRAIRRAIEGQLDAERSSDDAVPTAALVRLLADDPSFTREEAALTAVPAWCGKPASELLADAERRGWIAPVAGGRLAVTQDGRSRAEGILRARNL